MTDTNEGRLELVRRLRKDGMSYGGAIKDLVEVLAWAEGHLLAEQGKTHYEDCWRLHKDCAVYQVEQERKRTADLSANLRTFATTTRHIIDAQVKLLRMVDVTGEPKE